MYIGKSDTSSAMGGDGSTLLEINGSGAASNWCVYNKDCVYGIGTNANQLNVFGKGTAGINFEVSNASNAMVIDSSGKVGDRDRTNSEVRGKRQVKYTDELTMGSCINSKCGIRQDVSGESGRRNNGVLYHWIMSMVGQSVITMIG